MKIYIFLSLYLILLISCGVGQIKDPKLSGSDSKGNTIANRNDWNKTSLKAHLSFMKEKTFPFTVFDSIRLNLDTLGVRPWIKGNLDTIQLPKNYLKLMTKQHRLDSAHTAWIFQKYCSSEWSFDDDPEVKCDYLFNVSRGKNFDEVFILRHINTFAYLDIIIYLRFSKMGEVIYFDSDLCRYYSSEFEENRSYSIFDQDRNFITSQLICKGNVQNDSDYHYDSIVVKIQINGDTIFSQDTLFHKQWTNKKRLK